MKSMKYIVIIAGLVISTALNAQDTVHLKLDTAITLGLQSSKQLKINKAKIEQAVAQFQRAKSQIADVKIQWFVPAIKSS